MRILIAILLFAAFSKSSLAEAPQAPQAPQAPKAPDPGSPAIFKAAADLAAALNKATANATGMSSSNVTTNDQYRVSMVKRDKAAGALAHQGNTELLYIVEGEGTMVTGGKMIAAANGKPASIADGVSKQFVKGDVFIVPAGSPHWFAVIDKPVTYLEVRWVAPPPK